MCVVCLTVASLTAVAVSFAVSGCSKKAEAPKLASNNEIASNNSVPDWVLNPHINLDESNIVSVGMSEIPSRDKGLKFLLTQAELQAKEKIQNSLKLKVSKIVDDAIKQSNIDLDEKLFQIPTNEIIKNLPLSSAIKDKIFEDRKGVLYVRIAIKSTIVKQYFIDNLDLYTSVMEELGLSENTIFTINQTLISSFDKLDIKN